MLNDTAVMCTAWRRPYYFRNTLDKWSKVKQLNEVSRFLVALGRSDREADQHAVIEKAQSKFGAHPSIEILPDSDRAHFNPCVHTAIAEAADHLFQDPSIDFVVFGEEDIAVSDDILSYMEWAKTKFRDDYRVLCVCAHSKGGQGWDSGWDNPDGIQDADADQNAVRLMPYFNAWVWGTWRDRWVNSFRPKWDWNVSNRGYDWNIHTRIIPEGNFLCVIPDASRSQNTGEFEGFYAQPEYFGGSQSKSFRENRSSPSYYLIED